MLNRHVRGVSAKETSPQFVLGQAGPEEFSIKENGLRFSIRFHEGYSIGLFLDQRENRRRLLRAYIGPEFFAGTSEGNAPLQNRTVLNTFAYTCGFSVAAARAGARVTSLDLSKKYLEWGKVNFTLNQLDPGGHDFIFGDVFDWLRRFEKKKRLFDIVLLDPPTFSQSKEHGVFRAEKDYGELVKAAVAVLQPGGILFASTNAEDVKPEEFLETVTAAIVSMKRKILKSHYAPQPPDFPVSREERAYLKTVWMRIG
jgi:23S rRNA (cytosine1962-C5)-methyltransferase